MVKKTRSCFLKVKKQYVAPMQRDYYVTKIQHGSKIGAAEILANMKEDSRMTDAELLMFLSSLQSQIKQMLLSGHPIELDTLGTMRLRVSSTAQANEGDVSVSDVRKAKIWFNESKSTRAELKNVSFNVGRSDYVE